MPRKPDPEIWSYSYGGTPFTVTVSERHEAGRRKALVMRWTDPTKKTRDPRKKKTLAIALRDIHGRIDRLREADVQKEVRFMSASLSLGPAGVDVRAARTPENLLTVAEGLAIVLDPVRGKYVNPDNRRVKELRRMRDRLVGTDEPLLEAGITWSEWHPGEAEQLWRYLALRNKDKGPRHVEVMIDFIYASASWLRSRRVLPQGVAMPDPQWRKMLREHWGQITGWKPTEEQPRHTADEMGRIFTFLAVADIDPRIALAVLLGAELRLGQVGRCTRTDFFPDRDELAPHGVLHVRSAGKKQGAKMALSAEQRGALDEAMTRGYLREYEPLFAKKGLTDYYLFPAGRLHKVDGMHRVARPVARQNQKFLRREAMLDLFHKLEEKVGVISEKGRGWYGLRRLASDLAADIEHDPRVLDVMQGWKDPTTRVLIYQRRDDKKIALRAQEVREAMRALLPKPDSVVAA